MLIYPPPKIEKTASAPRPATGQAIVPSRLVERPAKKQVNYRLEHACFHEKAAMFNTIGKVDAQHTDRLGDRAVFTSPSGPLGYALAAGPGHRSGIGCLACLQG